MLRPGDLITDLWLGGLEATTATITITEGPGGALVFGPTDYALDGQGVHDWQAFFLAPVRLQDTLYVSGLSLALDPVITIRVANPGGVARLGAIQLGRFIGLGTTQYGVEFSSTRPTPRRSKTCWCATRASPPSGCFTRARLTSLCGASGLSKARCATTTTAAARSPADCRA